MKAGKVTCSCKSIDPDLTPIGLFCWDDLAILAFIASSELNMAQPVKVESKLSYTVSEQSLAACPSAWADHMLMTITPQAFNITFCNKLETSGGAQSSVAVPRFSCYISHEEARSLAEAIADMLKRMKEDQGQP